MKINKIKLATPEDNMKTQDFVDGAPMTPDENSRRFHIIC